MKRWLDALLSRWYVPRRDVIAYRRGAWTITRNEYGYSMSEDNWTDEMRADCLYGHHIVVTTDFSKGLPCS